MFRKTVLAAAITIGTLPAFASEVQFGMGNGLNYFQTSVTKNIANGQVFFSVTGFVADRKYGERSYFKALFNCGKNSQIAIQIEDLKKVLPISGRVAAMQNNMGNWYALQSAHCPNNHFLFDPRELVF